MANGEDDLGKYIKKVDMGPYVPEGKLKFVAGYSVPSEGGHVYVFGDPSNPYEQLRVVVDPNKDPLAAQLQQGSDFSVEVKGDHVTLDVKKPGGSEESVPLSRPQPRKDVEQDLAAAAIVPSLRTLGENQGVILDDMHTGFKQTYLNQQKMYSKLRQQEKILARVTAGVAGLTTLTYAVQQEINTLVIVFGVAFLALAAALGYLIWKQNKMERELLYAIAYGR